MKNTVFLLIVLFSSLFIFAQDNKIATTTNPKPFVLGVIEEIESKELAETRILNIYLPEGYSENDSINYPVIYLLDGSADEDFIHITGLVQYNSFEWVDRVPKSIVVGIATVDRKRDYTFPTTIIEDKKAYPTTGNSDKFIAFIKNELQPFIQAKYRTSDSKTIIGQSLGGLLATEVLFKQPDLFNTYIIISPSLWWDNGSLLNIEAEFSQESFMQPTKVYVGVGMEGPTPTAIPRVMEEDAKLLTNKIEATKRKNIHVYFDYLPDENHATIMHQAVSNAFRLLYSSFSNE